ncbi:MULTISPECIES: TetR/AcrR family transcriptional regulator [unclassified Chryseobacterium]|uniref:TetR/AcrR family transcriptional regulator n=2 Tax=Chryseobacterium TaxID=59732 RepID=UPI00226B416D|nr:MULTISPECIES: TetR/AcrR family transcriptional regulator [unclassified Chryseobacterium]
MMERKPAAGSIRNKERSKKKFLDAVGKILKTKGYAALKINHIAATAGVDKKMIYTYFGGMDGLLDEYIRSQDYWSNLTSDKVMPEVDDGGRKIIEGMLQMQYEYVHSNKDAQKLLLWRLAESRKALRKMTDTQEANGEYIFKNIADPHFGKHSEEFRSVMAIMVAGLYYLNMYSSVNGETFCGINLTTSEGRDHIKKAISFMTQMSYENL